MVPDDLNELNELEELENGDNFDSNFSDFVENSNFDRRRSSYANVGMLNGMSRPRGDSERANFRPHTARKSFVPGL